MRQAKIKADLHGTVETIDLLLTGQISPNECPEGKVVQDGFAYFRSCGMLEREIGDARSKLEERFGIENEGEDMMTIVRSCECMQELLAKKMYFYARYFALQEFLKEQLWQAKRNCAESVQFPFI